MRDSNLPKFLSEDAELFEAIVSDLFPGVEVPEVEQGDLARAIIESLEEHELQNVDKFVLKVVQMYETFNVRFGAMLVGPTGAARPRCTGCCSRRSRSCAGTATRTKTSRSSTRTCSTPSASRWASCTASTT